LGKAKLGAKNEKTVEKYLFPHLRAQKVVVKRQKIQGQTRLLFVYFFFHIRSLVPIRTFRVTSEIVEKSSPKLSYEKRRKGGKGKTFE
jgi:hypothetical protein